MKFFNSLPRWANWGLAFPLIVLNGWLFLLVFRYFQFPITIFIIANLLAFILNYPVRFLASHGIGRNFAVFIVAIFAILVLGIAGLILAPAIVVQLNELAIRIPSWIQSGTQQLQSFNDWAVAHNLSIDISGIAIQLTQRLSERLQSLTGQIISIVLGTVSSVLTIVLTVVLTLYLLLHGEELWEGVKQWLPQPTGTILQKLLRQNFQNYFIGQASLAAIIGTSMTLTFLLLQVPLGLLFGLGVGFMALFPFGAGFSITVVSLLMALKSFWFGLKVLVVAVIIEQIIENGIAPRLLGGFTGVNPVWILISLLIGTQIAGVLGLILAVPLAGFIKSATNILRTDSLNLKEELVQVK